MNYQNHPNNNGGGNGGGSPCGACKFLRRKCVETCIFAPYFDSEEGSGQFASVHKVFGASNVSKLLHQLPVSKRVNAVATICFEAQARLRDPVYGCVAQLFNLERQVGIMQTELDYIHAHLRFFGIPPPPPLPPMPPMPPQQLSFPGVPTGTIPVFAPAPVLAPVPAPAPDPASYEIPQVLLDPMPSWAMQQQAQQRGPMNLCQFGPIFDAGPSNCSASIGHGHGPTFHSSSMS